MASMEFARYAGFNPSDQYVELGECLYYLEKR